MARIDLGTYKKWKIGNVIRKILMDDADVHQAVGNNIYPVVAAENVVGDFINYTRTSYSKEYVKQGLYQDSCQEEILVISDKYDNVIDIAEKVDKALSGRHILDDGVSVDITLQTATEMFQDNKYVERMIFDIE